MILALSMLLTIATGCVKSNTAAKLDPNVTYYMKYETTDQAVKMRVIGDTLRLNLWESINVLVDPKDYANSWAIHLEEDTAHTYLGGLHFDALATAKGYAHDWVPINLNDAAPGQKTATNVTEDGKQYVKVTINRVLEFYNVLSSNQAAVAQQNTLLNTTNQTITYKLYYSDGSGYSKSTNGTFKLAYSNQ